MRSPLFSLLAGLLMATAAGAAGAESFDFPAGFTAREVPANGTTIHVRSAGSGPAVVLLHGYGESGDMWVPLAAALMKDH